MKKTLNLFKTKLVLTAFLFANFALIAQNNQEISGTITSSTDNAPIPGVNVLVVGTTNGTTTDFDGNYQINAPEGSKISFSFLGFVTKTISVSNQTTLDISLEEDSNELDEVIVVGYGARKKSDITGSVSSVKAEELNAFPVLDAAQALQGRAAGVEVQSNNGGEPGAPINIKIRGNTSINASSSPLIVVDGFVGATMPQATDIASMEVLKDASATAIYGSRGSNGVVMVTTKKGRKGKVSVELNSTYSVQQTANKLDLLNAEEFAVYQQAVNDNQNGGSGPTYNKGTEDTDWQDEIYQAGSTQQHQLSFSGGTDKLNFYASGNYFQQDGIVVNSGFERYTFLTNLDAQVNSKLKLGLNLFGGRDIKNGIPTQSTGSVTVGGDDVIALTMRFAPDLGITDSNGNFTTNSVGDEVDNPYAVATERINETISDKFRANFYADYEIIENLNFKTTFGFSSENQTEGLYLPSTLIVTASQKGGEATIENEKKSTVLSESYLTYNKEIGKGTLGALLGYSYQKSTTQQSTSGASGFPSNSVSFHNLGAGAVYLQPTSSLVESEIQSAFARVNYDYNDKYLLTATVRRDGASNFAANEKYATFPSAALGWKISNEEFLKENNTISNLKLRASVGVTGNQAISPYESLANMQAIYASTGGSSVNAVTPERPANPDLKWETSTQTNIGVDLGLINNRVNVSLDYYNIDTEDLILANTGLPSYFGFTGDEILANVGAINNSGIELSVNARIISKDDFTWTADVNFAANKTKVIKLIDGKDLYGSAAPSYFSVDNTYVLREGEAVGLFWGLDYIGVYQGGTLEEGQAVFDNAVAGDPMFKDFADENGDYDGRVTSTDEEIIGDPNADFTYGITNTFTYKNFDLNVFIQGSEGGEIFNMTNVQLNNGDSNTTRDYANNAWTPTNTETEQPRVGNNSNREISSRFIEDGSYVRLKNIALGYNLPKSMIGKIGIENVRITASAQNLLTVTNYSGLDPEVNYFGGSGQTNTKSNTAIGHDFGNYPTVQSFSLSLNVKF